MRFGWAIGRIGLLAAMLLWQVPAHAGVSAADVRAACAPGTDPQPAGSTYPETLNATYGALTPTVLPGVQTVSAGEAKCMIDRFGPGVAVFAALGDARLIPQSVPVDWAISPAEDGDIQQRLVRVAAAATGGDRNAPIIVYCHHESCFMSWNVALRLKRAGYRQIYWNRTGLLDWQKSSYPLVARNDRSLLDVRGRATSDFAARQPTCERTGTFGPRMLDLYVEQRVLQATGVEPYRHYADQVFTSKDARSEWMESAQGSNGTIRNCMSAPIRNYPPVREDGAYERELAALADASAGRWQALHDKDVAGYRAIADAFDADPQTRLLAYLTSAGIEPAALSATLAAAVPAQTSDRVCGTFDYSVRPAAKTEAEYKARLEVARKYLGCVRDNYARTPAFAVDGARPFALAVNWVKRARPYLCSVRRAANCLADARWQPIAAIATEANGNRVADVYNERDGDARAANLGILDIKLGGWVGQAGYYDKGVFYPG